MHVHVQKTPWVMGLDTAHPCGVYLFGVFPDLGLTALPGASRMRRLLVHGEEKVFYMACFGVMNLSLVLDDK